MSDIPALLFESAPAAPTTINVLLYGPPKSGKSTAAATAPGPIIWLNAEGPNALGFALKMAAERGTEVAVLRLDRFTDAQSLMRELILHVREGRDPQPATIVIDTLAKVREALVRKIVVPGAKDSRTQYGEVNRILRAFIQTLRDEPVNVILIAHQDVADVEGDRIVQPLIGGALQAEVPGEVDIIAYTHSFHDEESDTRRYVGQLVEAKGRIAGDRSGALEPVEDLDLTVWLAKYREGLTPDTTDLPWDDPDTALPLELPELEPQEEEVP